MKFLTRTTNLVFVSLLCFPFISCNSNNGEEVEQETIETIKNYNDTIAEKPNIRFIDADSLSANYTLAIELNEKNQKSAEQLQYTMKGKEAELQKLQNEIANKAQNNGYQSKESYEADVRSLQKKGENAQQQVVALERKLAEQQAKDLKQIKDSVDNYLEILAKTKGYDFILNKSTSAFYANPKYDITSIVIKGLNERYKKSKD